MKSWRDIREYHLKKLSEALSKDLVDKDIIPLLDAINNHKVYVTRSSCYGRVSFTIEKGIIRKGKGKIVYKVHGPIDLDTINNVAINVHNGVLWMNIEGTIVHVASKSIETALDLLDMARKAGYQLSNLYSYSNRGVTVEILHSEKYSLPIYCLDTGFLLNEDELHDIIKYVEERFMDIEKSKHKLINLLEKYKAYGD